MRTSNLRLLTLLLLAASAGPSPAVNFTVNSTTDAVDATPGDTTCATAGAVCTLRAAIQEANALAGDDTIDLPAGPYMLTIPPGAEGTATHDAAVGDLDITGNLTITGAGAATTSVDGRDTTRVFHVAASQTVTIAGLTIQNGADTGGAGIFAVGNLTLSNVVVTLNSANGAGGGGIRGGGSVTLNDSTVSDNDSTDQGGGIFGASPLVINRSTITRNRTPDQGGGIFTDGPLTIRNSTVAGNMSTGDQGGGIFIENGAMTIVNSTISGNTASSSGGGIFNNPPLGPTSNVVRIINATITLNTGNTGGGIFTFDPGVIVLRNTLIATNSNTGSTSPDFGGMLSSEGFNLIGSTDGATVLGDTTGNVVGQPPNLGPLTANGGPTDTHGLLPGSPAIDAGNPAGCLDADGDTLTTDQRGEPRPVGPRCDIGAFEGIATTTTTSTTLPPSDCTGISRATFVSLNCRLSALIAQVTASAALGSQKTKLQQQLEKAKLRKDQAEAFCLKPSTRLTKITLKRAIRRIIQSRTILSKPVARRTIAEPLRLQLLGAVEELRLDVRALKGSVSCPADVL